MTHLAAGPLLGTEGDNLYSVLLFFKAGDEVAEEELTKDVRLSITIDGRPGPGSLTPTVFLTLHYVCLRFSLLIPPDNEEQVVRYKAIQRGGNLVDVLGREEWEFRVPPAVGLPRLAFCSCNGSSERLPGDPPGLLRRRWPSKTMSLWRSMAQQHSESPFHYLVMAGDQIYADQLWDRVIVPGWVPGDADRDVVRRSLTDDEKRELADEVLKFYEDLYVATWSQPEMAAVLATVPSIMMWDDHDIFDGWGSHSIQLQQSDVFRTVFDAARRAFEIFQIRTTSNQSLLSATPAVDGYSMHMSLRSLELFVLDNRTHRTQTQVMCTSARRALKAELDHLFKDERQPERSRVLCVVVPVPIAHLDYSRLAESLLSRLSRGRFRHTIGLADDAIDHWDHDAHKDEQGQLLRTVFDGARASEPSPYYVCFISGDVHTAGAATVTRSADGFKATQLVSSGIVHKPPNRVQLGVIRLASAAQSSVSGYSLDLRNFGSYRSSRLLKRFGMSRRRVIRRRNFGILQQLPGDAVKATLCFERRTLGGRLVAPAYRTLNKFPP